MADYKKVFLKTAGGEYVYPEIDPSDTGGVFIINYTLDETGTSDYLIGDKTWEQAFEAFATGKRVINHKLVSYETGYIEESYVTVSGIERDGFENVEYYMLDDIGQVIDSIFSSAFLSASSSGMIKFEFEKQE